MSAALLMGSAVDKACEALMKDPSVDANDIFYAMWSNQEINKVPTFLPYATNIVYADADFDAELLLPGDWQRIKNQMKAQYPTNPPTEEPEAFISKIYGIKGTVGFANLSEQMKVILNFANWLCLASKGLLMIEAVKRDFVPNIVEVLSAQEKIELEHEGDSVLGYIDLVARWKGYDKPVVLDFKTSARKYDEETSVIMSPQLSLYMNAVSDKYENTRLAGFLVLSKQIKKNRVKICAKCGNDGSGGRHKTCDKEIEKKRCHGEWKETLKLEATTQTIIREIPPRTEEIVMENISYINDAIKNGIFHRNLNACGNNGGFMCEFIGLCYKNSEEGLIKV